MPNTILNPNEAAAEIKALLVEFVGKEVPHATESEKVRLMWRLLGADVQSKTIQSSRPF
jgi:hypothetical protein